MYFVMIFTFHKYIRVIQDTMAGYKCAPNQLNMILSDIFLCFIHEKRMDTKTIKPVVKTKTFNHHRPLKPLSDGQFLKKHVSNL